MKFVIIQSPAHGSLVREMPVIFPNDLSHSDVVKALLRLKELQKGKVVSAGFVNSFDLNCSPHGKSVSLGGLCTRPGDEQLLTMVDYHKHVIDKDVAEKPIIECKCGQKNRVMGDGSNGRCGKCKEVLTCSK